MRTVTQDGTAVRAKKDERPKTTATGRVWHEVAFTLNGEATTGLIAQDWLYFEEDGQWYKLNVKKSGVSLEGLQLYETAHVKQSKEEKRARRQSRRRAKRAAIREEAAKQ